MIFEMKTFLRITRCFGQALYIKLENLGLGEGRSEYLVQIIRMTCNLGNQQLKLLRTRQWCGLQWKKQLILTA